MMTILVVELFILLIALGCLVLLLRILTKILMKQKNAIEIARLYDVKFKIFSQFLKEKNKVPDQTIKLLLYVYQDDKEMNKLLKAFQKEVNPFSKSTIVNQIIARLSSELGFTSQQKQKRVKHESNKSFWRSRDR